MPQGRPQPAAATRPGDRPQSPDRARLTSRAGVLAVVICAVALSLAYPIREYIAQRRQIDQLQSEHQVLVLQLRRQEAELGRLKDPAYIKQRAMDELHLCMPNTTCYVVIPAAGSGARARAAAVAGTPWYERLWRSVKQADRGRRQ